MNRRVRLTAGLGLVNGRHIAFECKADPRLRIAERLIKIVRVLAMSAGAQTNPRIAVARGPMFTRANELGAHTRALIVGQHDETSDFRIPLALDKAYAINMGPANDFA